MIEAFLPPVLIFIVILAIALVINRLRGGEKGPTQTWVFYRDDMEPSKEHGGARGYWVEHHG